MQLSLVSFCLSLSLAWTTVSAAEDVLGTSCNITGTSALDSNFTGMARVAAPPYGCTIGILSDCYCGPVLDGDNSDEDVGSDWLWQCGDNVLFGPVDSKDCPSALPSGTCNTTIHPTGFAGDPACGYSDCDTDATFSSVCGCIDLSLFGTGDGMVWTCLQSTCDCPPEPTQTPTSSGSTTMWHLIVAVVGVVLATALAH